MLWKSSEEGIYIGPGLVEFYKDDDVQMKVLQLSGRQNN